MQPLGVGFQVPKGWGHLGLVPGPHFQASSDLRWVPESLSDKGRSGPSSTEDSWLPWVTQPPDLWLPAWVSPIPPQPRGNTTSSPGLGWIRDSSLQVSLKSCSGKRGAGSFLSKHRMASAMSFPIEEDICPASCSFTLGHSEGQKTWWFTQDRWPCWGLAFPCSKDTLVSSVLLQRTGLRSSYQLINTKHLNLPEFSVLTHSCPFQSFFLPSHIHKDVPSTHHVSGVITYEKKWGGRIGAPPLPLLPVTLNKFLILSEPQFAHL